MKASRIMVSEAVAFACGFLLLGSPSGFAQDVAGLPEIRQSAKVDETLFLVRVLESLYEQWPSDVSSPDAFVAAAGQLRKQALRYRQYIHAKNLAPDLGARFGDVVSNLDAYTTFLANLDIIQEEAVRRLQQDSFQSGYKGGFAAGTTLAQLSQSEDISSGDAAGVAILVGGITWAVDAWQKADKRDRVRQQAVEAEARRIGDLLQTSLIQAQTTVHELARQHKWGPGEFGWELSDDQAAICARLSQAGDFKGLAQIAERQSALRPRDPFPRLARNILKALASESDAASLAAAAKDIYLCISLIPSGEVYDDYRLGYVSVAALILNVARSCEVRYGTNPYGSTANSKLAVSLWRKVLELSPSDPSGELRENLAVALLGDNSIKEARQFAGQIAALRKTEPGFCYSYACILSRGKDATSSLAWFEASIKAGFADVVWASKDPDLCFLREAKTQAFNDLVRPKYSWSVTDDILWDDVILRNDSAFPITTVKLSVTLKRGATQQSAAYQKALNLTCDRLGPGESKTWADVVAGPEGTWDNSSTASLQCDQDK